MRAVEAVAVAHANIALVKYWGKSDRALNLPAVPSVSLTLSPLSTTTRARFDEAIDDDRMTIDGRAASVEELRRCREMLDWIRARADCRLRAVIETSNSFPTASGLASSASGFAALVAAVAGALGLDWSTAQLSAAARRGSASAARSIYGGFAYLPAGVPGDDSLAASEVAPVEHWDLRMSVAVTAEGPKETGSRVGMNRVTDSSPYHSAWVADAPRLSARALSAIAARDLESLGAVMELSTMRMHACALGGDPPLLYWRPATLAALETVRELRRSGLLAFATMDAGPHVKVLSSALDAPAVASALRATPGVLRVIEASPGPGVSVTRDSASGGGAP